MRGRIPKPILAVLSLALLAVLAGGLITFQPWKAFTDTTVDEALPTAPAAPTTTTPAATPPAGRTTNPSPPASSAASTDLGRGSFVSGEHTTTGRARLIRLADGSAVLRLEDLATSEGPDVRVYLSTRPAAESKLDNLGPDAVELSRLKGNLGNQNYAVPAGTDLTRFHSAVIWCKRFSVGFGAADLTTTATQADLVGIGPAIAVGSGY
ncbi:DM13 domain-containing protein [Kitasatospora sp. NPDC051853]|uniref:DM13 domain-containing protein n=1 Tax=Kitasatospora sp. NPDC051853 TaxID=3364058 RepID=UPI0037A42456